MISDEFVLEKHQNMGLNATALVLNKKLVISVRVKMKLLKMVPSRTPASGLNGPNGAPAQNLAKEVLHMSPGNVSVQVMAEKYSGKIKITK